MLQEKIVGQVKYLQDMMEVTVVALRYHEGSNISSHRTEKRRKALVNAPLSPFDHRIFAAPQKFFME